MPVTPVSLLCGFLGAGKTTLLRAVLEQTALANAAVIVNEFGEVSIDHLVVADLTENILELRNGCLCCTIRGDLTLTLRDLYQRRQLGDIKPFDQVIVETSGLANPIPIIHTLMVNPALMKAYCLDTVVCVVDAVNGSTTIDAHDSAANQLALADLIILSKGDIATKEQLAQTLATIADVNPSAEVRDVIRGEIDCTRVFGRRLFNPLKRSKFIDRWLGAHPDHSHDSVYVTHTITRQGTLSLAGTSVFLNHVVNQQREHILRIKGLAGFRERDDRPALLHAVQDKFYPLEWLDAWPNDDHSSRLVFIGRDLDTAWLDAKFDSLCL